MTLLDDKSKTPGVNGGGVERGSSSRTLSLDEELAIKNGIHIDVAANPFISEEQRKAVLERKVQDPEWD
jgi:hypothetical protein